MSTSTPEPERDDPLGGAFGAVRSARAGGFVFTSAVTGVIGMEDGVLHFADTFDAQLLDVGERLGRRLATFGCTGADILDATVWLHPSVDIDPGELLDRLQEQVFSAHSPALSIVRAVNLYDDVLVSVKVIAYQPD